MLEEEIYGMKVMMRGFGFNLCPAAMRARLPVPGILMANSENIKMKTQKQSKGFDQTAYLEIAPVGRVRLCEDGEEGGYQGNLPAPGADDADIKSCS